MIRDFSRFVKKTLDLPGSVGRLTDKRQRKSKCTLVGMVMRTVLAFSVRVASVRSMARNSTVKKRLDKAVGGPSPSSCVLYDTIARIDSDEIMELLTQMVIDARKAGLPEAARIDGEVVGAVDGVENFKSKLKKCIRCLVRRLKGSKGEDEKTQNYHRLVVVSHVGHNAPLVICGADEQGPGDGKGKAEGELTVGKRLQARIAKVMGIRYLTADAPYANGPMLRLIRSLGSHLIVRIKKENTRIHRKATAMFKSGEGRMEEADFTYKEVRERVNATNGKTEKETKTWDVKVWKAGPYDLSGPGTMMTVYRFDVTGPQKATETMLVATGDPDKSPEFIWKCAHFRWDLELSGFHVLKTYCHFSHCSVHEGLFQEACPRMISCNAFQLFRIRMDDPCRKLSSITELVNILHDDMRQLRKPLWGGLGAVGQARPGPYCPKQAAMRTACLLREKTGCLAALGSLGAEPRGQPTVSVRFGGLCKVDFC